jgi:hypothetical protein
MTLCYPTKEEWIDKIPAVIQKSDKTARPQTVTKETQSYYQYEVDLNETKRDIKLLKPEFVSAVEKEFKKVIK